MPAMIVTGASSGIGQAVAELALKQGWQVAGLSRRAKAPAGALALACDVTDPASVNAAFQAAVAEFGHIDAVFANAGMFPKPALIDEVSDDDWRQAMSVNLDGMFNTARAAFAQMRGQTPQGGRIILNGSISAHAPRPLSLAYTVAKHALTGMTRQLALDGRPFDIAAGQIDIGNALTELAAQAQKTRPTPEPMMPVEQAAQAVMLMASQPAGTNVLNMTIMATEMALVGRG